MNSAPTSALLQLIRRARKKSAALPVFVTSSDNEEAEISAAMSDGRIGQETLVVVIQKLSDELVTADG
jgi:hypothetical protein